MHHSFDSAPVSIDFCSKFEGTNLLSVGLLSGELHLFSFKNSELAQSSKSKGANGLLNDCLWSRSHKRAVRKVRFSANPNQNRHLYTVTKNRALVQWDLETGKKVRCLKTAHDSPPHSLCSIPHSSSSNLFLATGDDGGVVKLWDMNSSEPEICQFQEQDDCITDLAVSTDGKHILATSDDATLASYNFPGRKLEIRSEPMHSELLSLVVSQNHVICGAGDGFLEVFRDKEYGNILERINSGHQDTVDCLALISPTLIASGSTIDGTIRLIHLYPNRNLGEIGRHDEVEEISLTPDRRWLVSCGHDNRIKFWDLRPYLKQIRSAETKQSKKFKKMRLKSETDNFFQGLLQEQ